MIVATIKKYGWMKIVAFVLILVFFASLITYKIALPAAEDLPRQMMNGHDIFAGNFDVLYKNVYSYTSADHEFANHHWLYGVIMYVVHAAVGFEGIVIGKVILFLFSLGLLFYVSLKRANFWLVAVFSIPTILMLMGRSAARPEMFSYLFAVLYIYFLNRFREKPSTHSVFWIVFFQLLWANIHILFPAGVAIVGAFWLEAVITHWKGVLKNSFVRKLTLVLALTTLISFANPLGIDGVLYSMKANTINATKIFSAEVQSIKDVFNSEPRADYVGPAIFAPLFLLFIASFVVGYKKKNIAYLVLGSAFAYLSFKIIRGVPMFALIFLPAITSNLDGSLQRCILWIQKRWPHTKALLEKIIPVVFICIVLWGIVVWRARLLPYMIPGVGLTETATESARFFKENKLKGPILNDTDIGSYLIYYLYPTEKVFVDNRFGDAYGREFLEDDYRALFTDETKWKEKLDKYKFNTIVLNHYDRGSGLVDFMFNRIYDPEWVWVYAGRDVVIFVRNVPENDAVIQKYAITPENVQEKLRDLATAPDYHGQVAAADLYSYLGNTKFSLLLYEKIVSKWPHLGKIWFIIGRNELLRADQANADSAFALIALQNAIREGYKTPFVYSYLALAHYRLGDIEETEKAVEKELKIDPENEDGLAWLEILKKERLQRYNTNDTR